MTDDLVPAGGATDDAVSDLTLADLMAEAAEDLAGVVTDATGPVTTWAAGPSVFATLEGGRAEFRLDTQVAAAALRTPDTSSSARGSDCARGAPRPRSAVTKASRSGSARDSAAVACWKGSPRAHSSTPESPTTSTARSSSDT